MEQRRAKMRPQFWKGFRINSAFSRQNLIKKGFKILPKLAIELRVLISFSLTRKINEKVNLVKMFKKIKHVKNLDLNQLLLEDRNLYLSAFLYIIKRMSKTLASSVFDYRSSKSNYRGLFTICPKQMKHLKSLQFKFFIESVLVPNPLTQKKISKDIKLMTDFLKYLQKLENIQILCPLQVFSTNFDKLWEFEKYPVSIERLALQDINYSKGIPDTSLTHLKKLKDLEIILLNSASLELMKFVTELICQVSQLEALNIRFVDGFEIDASVCEAIKSLTGLKKAKFQLSLLDYENNLKILESLEECPLESLNLKIFFRSNKCISLITNLLKKKKDHLGTLKLQLLSTDTFEGSENMNELVQAIEDLFQLTSLYFLAKPNKFSASKARILTGNNAIFSKILLKDIPIRKFRLSLYQPDVPKEELFALVESLKKVSLTLQKLEIHIGRYKPKDTAEIETILEFIRSLKNVQSLKLASIDVLETQFLSRLIDVVYSLKSLRSLSFGEVSGDITPSVFVKGVEKILSKKGLEKFDCYSSIRFQRSYIEDAEGFTRIDLKEIRKKNPSFRKGPPHHIYS